MDIVYILKETKDCNNELLFSLRSLKNIPHRSVFIIWHKPEWVKNIVHIPASDPYEIKSLNALHKIQIACNDERISSDFVFMNDDFYLLKPIKKIDYFNRGSIKEHIEYRESLNQKKWAYYTNLKKTHDLFPDWKDFSLHCPIIYNKTKFLKMCGEYDMSQWYLLRNLYCNYCWISSEFMRDCKAYEWDEFKVSEEQIFLSSDDKILKKDSFKKFINEKFNTVCKYEWNIEKIKNLIIKNKSMKTVKVKFIKSLYPYKKCEEVEMLEHKITPLVLRYAEIISWEKKITTEKPVTSKKNKKKKNNKKKNKAILETKENK